MNYRKTLEELLLWLSQYAGETFVLSYAEPGELLCFIHRKEVAA